MALGVGSSDLGELHPVHGPPRGLPQGHSGDPQEKLWGENKGKLTIHFLASLIKGMIGG